MNPFRSTGKGRRTFFIIAGLFAGLCCAVDAQEAAGASAAASAGQVLVPQTVYVGDRARLIVPVDGAAMIGAAVVLDVAERLPRSKDATVLRVELQHAEGGWRVLVDFTAYASGRVELPRIEVGGIVLTGLSVTIASILETEGGSAELSPPAGPLSAPGTTLLVYGSAFALVTLALVITFLFLRGPALIREALERRRRGLVARSMRRVISRLAENAPTLEGAEFLSILFPELRSYLSYRTGVNCLTLTPREFPAAMEAGPQVTTGRGTSYVHLETSDGAFLERLFRWGDEVRFGGAAASRSALNTALEEVVALVEKVEALLELASVKRRDAQKTESTAEAMRTAS